MDCSPLFEFGVIQSATTAHRSPVVLTLLCDAQRHCNYRIKNKLE